MLISSGPSDLIPAHGKMLRAANGTDIYKYGRHSLTLDLGLNSKFRWVGIVVEDPCPIIGIEISQYFDLIVDDWHRKVLDYRTSVTITGSHVVVSQITPQ